MNKDEPTRDDIKTPAQAKEYNRKIIKKLGGLRSENFDEISRSIARSPMIITLEGKDRVGKTTQAEMLREALEFDIFKFPNEKVKSGEILRKILNKELPHEPWSFQALMIFNKEESIPFIKKLGYTGGGVVFDRGHESAKVYGVLDGIPEVWIDQFDGRVPHSDLIIILDGKGWENDVGIYSDPEFQKKVRAGYLHWFEKHRYNVHAVLINADRPREEIFRDIVLAIQKIAESRYDYWLVNRLSKVIKNE